MARPSDFSLDLAAEICARLAEGQPLVKICRDDAMPGTSTVYRWLADKPEFRELYARAREDQADTLADEIIDIADQKDGEADTPDSVNRARLRVDARKWIASKLKPKRYGDKIDHEHTGGLTVKLEQSDSGL
jgi:hypothetical protein